MWININVHFPSYVINIISTKLVPFCQNEVVKQGSVSATNNDEYCQFMRPWQYNTCLWSHDKKSIFHSFKQQH